MVQFTPVITDYNGNIIARYEYDSWGKLLSITDANGEALTEGSLAEEIALMNPFRYRSYQYDDETGLYYLKSRYYDPETGRFVNADTIKDGGANMLGNNLFMYAANNPINNFDPTGY